MKFRISPLKILIAALAIVVAVPTMAYATNTFPDVPTMRFYHGAVEWAFANGITVGCNDGTAFCGEDPVTRGENITFAKRYDDNIVQPALSILTTDVAATRVAGTQDTTFDNEVTVDGSAHTIATVVATNPAGTDVALVGHVYLERFAASTGRYFVQIVLGDCATGTVLGEGWWRPGVSTSAFQADTIAVTGFSASTPAGATFSLCANVFNGPDATAWLNGLIATW